MTICTIIRIELGIAGALGDFTQGFCVICALPELFGRCQNGQATLAEGGTLEDPAGFVKRINALMLELSAK